MLKIGIGLSIGILTLYANGLLVETSLGKGGTGLTKGGETISILMNPAASSFLSNDTLDINLMNGKLGLSEKSAKFIKDLNSASNSSSNEKNQKISDLLNQNIGEPFHISVNNFSSVSRSGEKYSWLVGILSTLDASFIAHTGFGSLGALESEVNEYYALVSNIAIKEEDIKYGFTLKAINKYQISHNYSILEMLEASSISWYFDNQYREKKSAIAFDAGAIYTFKDSAYTPEIGFSILNVGDTNFQSLGTIPQTSNIGLSFMPYKKLVVAIDYMDLLNQNNELYASDNLRVGLSSKFFENRLELSSGIYNESLTLGLNYQFTHAKLGLNTYERKGYNKNFREYQLSLAINW